MIGRKELRTHWKELTMITRTRLLAALVSFASALAPLPALSQVTVVMSGLQNPRGLAFGPDGGLYVAEGGIGGTTPTSLVLDGQPRQFGTTGAVSRLLAGVQERVVTGLPSLAPAGGASAGSLQDIAFDSAGEAFGLLGLGSNPAGRATLGSDGANLGQLVHLSLTGGAIQPVADITGYEGTQNPDGGPIDSNPFGLLSAPGGFVVADAGANAILNVTSAGVISTLSVVPTRPNPLPMGPPMFQAVPTAVTLGPDGAYYVGELTGFPFPPGAANVYRVDATTGDRTIAHSGFTNIVDLTFDPDGNLYVLQISTNGLASASGPGPGALIQVAADTGDRTTIASAGLSFPTAVALGPDGMLYVSNMGTSPGDGQVVRVIPEPSALALAGIGLVGVLAYDWRRAKRRFTTEPVQ
jgi:hypothetical protein